MKQALLDLLTSKKFIAALIAILVYVGGRFGLALDPVALDHIFAALLVYVGAQGIADHGAPAARLAAAGAVKVAEVNAASAVSVASVQSGEPIITVTPPSSDPAPSPPSRGGFAPLGVLALVMFGLTAGAMVPACAGSAQSTRAATISSLQTGVQTATGALRSYEHERATAIIEAAPDKATGVARLHELRSKIDKAWLAVDIARAAIDAANTVNDETSIAGARTALANAITAIATLTGGTTP